MSNAGLVTGVALVVRCGVASRGVVGAVSLLAAFGWMATSARAGADFQSIVRLGVMARAGTGATSVSHTGGPVIDFGPQNIVKMAFAASTQSPTYMGAVSEGKVNRGRLHGAFSASGSTGRRYDPPGGSEHADTQGHSETSVAYTDFIITPTAAGGADSVSTRLNFSFVILASSSWSSALTVRATWKWELVVSVHGGTNGQSVSTYHAHHYNIGVGGAHDGGLTHMMLQTPQITLPVGDHFSVAASLSGRPSTGSFPLLIFGGGDGGEAQFENAAALYLGRLNARSGGEGNDGFVFDLPDGYTVNSAQASVVDNVATGVPSPGSAALAFAGAVFGAPRRRR